MKKIFSILVLGLALALPLAAAENQKDLMQSRQQIQKLGKGLKKELVTAMKANGPVHAIGVCNLKAPMISASVSADDLDVARTSLKIRNEKNAPDVWELKVLKQFEKRKASGENIAKMDYYEVVDQKGVSKFRYMKAIGTDKVCLNCHGSDLKPKIAEKLDDLYPLDQARGFKIGDIRGAFTVSKTIN